MTDTQQWYYTLNGNRHGPVTSAQLKQLAQTNQLSSTDLVWKHGMQEWQQACKINGLIPSAPPISAIPISPQYEMPPSMPLSSNIMSNLFSNLTSPLASQIWIKAISGAGLFFVLIGLLSPWYTLSSSTTVDTSNMRGMPGFGGNKSSNFGGGGFSMNNDGFGKSSSEMNVNISGFSTFPGILALLGFVAAAGLSFVPIRWAALGAAGAGCFIFLALLIALIAIPSARGGGSFGGPGMGASNKSAASYSWGIFVTGLGNFAVLAGPLLAFLGIGITALNAKSSASI